jgi:hypothetical protein
MAIYKKTSPWYITKQNTLYLELLTLRTIPTSDDDFKYVIENQYRHRPDLLAFDLYQDAKLWWVFAQRNRSILKDPIYDFSPGTTIFCPAKANINATLSTTAGS